MRRVARGGLQGLFAVIMLTAGLRSVPPVAASVDLGAAVDVAIDDARGLAFIAGGPGTDVIWVSDLAGAAVDSVPDQPDATAVVLAPDGKTLFAALSGSSAISVIDTATFAERTRVGTPPCPKHLALAGGRLWFGYGCGTDGHGVGIGSLPLTTPSSPTLTPLPVGFLAAPYLAAAGPEAGRLYAADVDAHTIASGAVEGFDLNGPAAVSFARNERPGPFRVTRDLDVTPDGSRVLVSGGEPMGVEALSGDDLSGMEFYPAEAAWPTAAAVTDDGTHLAVMTTSYEDGSGPYPRLLVFALGRTVAVSGRTLNPELRATTRYAPHVAHWAPDGDSLFLARSDDVRSTLRREVGLGHDPARLSLTAVPDSTVSVILSGQLDTSDGTPTEGLTITLTMSGQPGTTDLPPVTTGPDGSYTTRAPLLPGGATYRASWAGDGDHAAVLATASVAGDPITLPAAPLPVLDQDIELDTTEVFDLVVDDLHHRVFISAAVNRVLVYDFLGNKVGELEGFNPTNVVGPGSAALARLALSPDRTTLYVSEFAADAIAVVDTARLTVVGRFPVGPAARQPFRPAEAGGRLWFGYGGGLLNGLWASLPTGHPADVVDHEYDALALEDPSFATTPIQPTRLWAAETGTNLPDLIRYDTTDAHPAVEVDVGADDQPGYFPENIFQMVMAPDGESVFIAGGYPYEVTQLDSETFAPLRHFPTGFGTVAVAVTGDGRHVATGSPPLSHTDPAVTVWTIDGQPTQAFRLEKSLVNRGLSFSADGTRLFALSGAWNEYVRSLHIRRGPNAAPVVPIPDPVPPVPPVPVPPVPIPPVPLPATAPQAGYWTVDTAGTVTAFGAVDHGGVAAASPVVDIEPAPGGGYWILDRAGVVTAKGPAPTFGNLVRSTPGEHAVSLSANPAGPGYWIFTDTGRVAAIGGAPSFGDLSGRRLNGPVVGSVATSSGHGYYLVGSDGGIFTFGDARFLGSMGATRLNAPVRSLVPDPDGTGYWLVASDGGIFAFDAPFRGSMGGSPLNRPVTGMITYGNGYLMVAEDGGVFNFSNQPFLGSLGTAPSQAPVVAIAAVPTTR